MALRVAKLFAQIWGTHSAACAATRHALLQKPEMQADCRAAPALARQLRPLCHMLGVELPDCLKLAPHLPRPENTTRRPPRQRSLASARAPSSQSGRLPHLRRHSRR